MCVFDGLLVSRKCSDVSGTWVKNGVNVVMWCQTCVCVVCDVRCTMRWLWCWCVLVGLCCARVHTWLCY